MRQMLAIVVLFCAAVSGAQQWSGRYNADLKNRYFGTTVCAVFADQTVIQQETLLYEELLDCLDQ